MFSLIFSHCWPKELWSFENSDQRIPAKAGPLRFLSRARRQIPFHDILQYISTRLGYLDAHDESLRKPGRQQDRREAVLYLPAEMEIPPTITELQDHCRVRVEHLPVKITGPGEIDISKITTEGLLYLENPYVVPGGQFNEMYGWDSYFIIRGLLRDHRTDLAKGMVENFFFEIDHYGGVLNANRTYYLTRSQPPFLSSMILAVYDAEKAAGKANLPWLEKAYQFAVAITSNGFSHRILPATRASRAISIMAKARSRKSWAIPATTTAGWLIFSWFMAVPRSYLVHDSDSHASRTLQDRDFQSLFAIRRSATPATIDCALRHRMALTADFYKGDRSMRESGFDVTFRFGPFGAETHHFAPVCLNSLLYKTEKDLERMSILLGHPEQARIGRQSGRKTAADGEISLG